MGNRLNRWFSCSIPLVGIIFFTMPGKAQVSDLELVAADNGLLLKVPNSQLPPSGNYLSWQRPSQPPLPFDPLPGLDVYDLGQSRFLVDDRLVNYEATASASESDSVPPPPGGGSSGSDDSGTWASQANVYACGLWLEISLNPSNANTVLLSLHDTRQGQVYTILSITNLNFATNVANWSVETNVTGAIGNLTQVPIPMSGRTNLFFKASEVRNYSVDANSTFTALGYTNTLQNPPDTMGPWVPTTS